MATVTKGGVTATTKRESARAPKTLREQIAEDDAVERPIAYVTHQGADAAWIIPSRPLYGKQGEHIGFDNGVHLDFRGVGVTRPYYLSNPVDAAEVARVDDFIDSNNPLVHELGLTRLEPDAPRPPFAKWDKLSASALKVALNALMGDDHDANVGFIRECARYEAANGDRDEVMGLLDSFLVAEATVSDAFDAEVSIS